MKNLISNFVRIVKAGATTDGRNVTREQIEQMSANYDRAKYGARIWLEHIRGLFGTADAPFNALGDVVDLDIEADGDDLYLRARLAPTPELVEMNARAQKIFTSIEIDPSFADTGEAYLVGLAVTDSPASLGTEALQFKTQSDHGLFEQRKQRPDNLFSENLPAHFEFADQDDQSLIDKIKQMLSRQPEPAGPVTEPTSIENDYSAAILAIAADHLSFSDAIETATAALADQVKALSDKNDQLTEALNAVTKKLESETDPQHTTRPNHSGETLAVLTDC